MTLDDMLIGLEEIIEEHKNCDDYLGHHMYCMARYTRSYILDYKPKEYIDKKQLEFNYEEQK